MWNLENGADEPVCRAEIETQSREKRRDTKGGKWWGFWWDELGDWD